MRDPQPTVWDSKPRNLGPKEFQEAICKQEGHDTGRENALAAPRGMELSDPRHYPQRQMVQRDEEWQGQEAPKLELQLTCEELQLTLDMEESLSDS